MVPVESERASVPRRGVEHAVLLVGSLLGVVALVALGVLLEPDPRGFGTHEQLGMRPCYPLVTFDLPCPGCGLTTSVVRLVHGDLLGSLAAQPLGTVLAVGLLVLAGWGLAVHARGRDLWVELNRWLRPGRVAAFLAFAALSWLYKVALVRGWL